MAYLLYGIEQGEGFIVVTGGIGTGKSTLVQGLFNSIISQNFIAAKLVTTQLEADDMLRMVASSFGLQYERVSKTRLLNDIETFLKKSAWSGKRVLLVIDEAQNLPKKSLEELRMLSNFQEHGVALLQTFLLGQEEFIDMLQEDDFEQLRQRVIASYNLTALGEDEIKGYIERRLTLTGWGGDPLFKASAYEEIFNFTRGVPRRINTLCDRLLVHGCLEELHEFDDEAVICVMQEINGEVVAPKIRKANKPELVGGAFEADAGLAVRLDAMEKRLGVLEEALLMERARIRRALAGNQ